MYFTQHNQQPTTNDFPMKNIFDYSSFQSKHILDSHRSYNLGSILKKINSRPCLQGRNNIILHLLKNNWNNTYNNILILNVFIDQNLKKISHQQIPITKIKNREREGGGPTSMRD